MSNDKPIPQPPDEIEELLDEIIGICNGLTKDGMGIRASLIVSKLDNIRAELADLRSELATGNRLTAEFCDAAEVSPVNLAELRKDQVRLEFIFKHYPTLALEAMKKLAAMEAE